MRVVADRFRKAKPDPAPCACGCGLFVAPGNKYVHGHNAKSAHPMLGRKHSDETRKKLRESHLGQIPWIKGKTHSDDVRKALSDALSGRTLSEEHRRNIGRAERGKPRPGAKGRVSPMKGRHHTPEAKAKTSLSKKGKRCSPATEFTSELLKARYRDPAYIQKMASAWNMKPNKPEALLLDLLESLYPGEWKYTGDFSFTINGKCPDFVNCNGQKKIIELFGDYWRRGQDPADRVAAFNPFGYQTLVIWEHELKHAESVTEKIRVFAEAA